MRFVPVKEEHQQVILVLHRTRNGFVEERTATDNRLRRLISEFGIVCPQKIANLRRTLMDHLDISAGAQLRLSASELQALIALLQVLLKFAPGRTLAWVKEGAPILCSCCGAVMVIVRTRIRSRIEGVMSVPIAVDGAN